MPAIADARGLEIEAVLPGKHLRNHHTVVHYLELHGNIGMQLRLRPARNDLAIGNFEITPQRPVLRNELPHLLGATPNPAPDRRALASLNNWGAKFPRRRCGVRWSSQDLMRVLEHPSVVAINISLGRGALGVNHVMRGQLDMAVTDRIDPICNHNTDAIHQLAGRPRT